MIKAGCIDGVDAAKEFVPSVEIFTRSRVPVRVVLSRFAIAAGRSEILT